MSHVAAKYVDTGLHLDKFMKLPEWQSIIQHDCKHIFCALIIARKGGPTK